VKFLGSFAVVLACRMGKAATHVTVEAFLKEQGVSLKTGLSAAEVAKRQEKYGRNELEQGTQRRKGGAGCRAVSCSVVACYDAMSCLPWCSVAGEYIVAGAALWALFRRTVRGSGEAGAGGEGGGGGR
jgi:hypothetical protein